MNWVLVGLRLSLEVIQYQPSICNCESYSYFIFFSFNNHYLSNNKLKLTNTIQQSNIISRYSNLINQIIENKMKPISKLKPLVQKSSPFKGAQLSYQQNMMSTLAENIHSLTSQIKILSENISTIQNTNQMASSIDIPDKFIPRQQQKQQKLFDRRETRFQTIDIEIPSKSQLLNGNIQQNIKQWLGRVCKEVFSIGFEAYHSEMVGDDKLKAFCSENLLMNILKLSYENNFTVKQFRLINQCLKNDLIPYFTLKYPLTDDNESTVRFARQIVEKNSLDEAENDLVWRSGIKFQKQESGNYNEEIMRFLNYIINTPNTRMKELFPKFARRDQLTLANQFVEDMEKAFNVIESKHKVYQLKLFNPNNFSKDFCFDEKQDPSSAQQQHQYEQKVRAYTQQKIGRKIQESLLPYPQKQCLAGNLKIEKSSIMRIVTKWCQELQKNFNFDLFISNQSMLRMKKGNVCFLKFSDLKVLGYLLQYEKRNIDEYIRKVMEDNYEKQSQFSRKDVDQKLRLFSEGEAMVGQFSSIILQCNENYLIGYLNMLIHSIMNALQFYEKYLENPHNAQITTSINYLSLTNPESIDQFVNQLQKAQEPPQKHDYSHKIPELITFKIGDLLRCKCSSKEDQILTLYKYFEYLSQKQPKYLKIVRLKNRLDKGTKDILLNLMYRDTMLVEIQLSIKSQSSKFIQKSNKFAHYLYQLERAQFGPISELCNIWINRDLRSKYYTNFFHSQNTRNNQEAECAYKSGCCMDKKNEKNLNLPFNCDDCHCFYFDCNYIHPHTQCRVCLKKVCVRCYYEKGGFNKLVEAIPEIQYSVLQLKRNNIGIDELRLCRQIPEYGFLLNLRSKKIIYKFFYCIIYQKSAYLFEHTGTSHHQSIPKTPDFTLIQKINIESKEQINKFFNSNLVYTSQTLRTMINKIQLSKAEVEYFVPQQLERAYKNHALSLNITEKKLTEDVFGYISPQFKYIHVSKINFSNNQFRKLAPIIQLFPDLQQAILNENTIEEIPDQIGEWGLHLKKLQLKKNKISKISDKIGQLRLLTDLMIHNNYEIASLPESIKQLVNLEELWVTHCRIQNLPSGIGDLKKLKILMVFGNDLIKALPKQIGQLESLQQLSIDNCQSLRSLPKSLSKLKNLKLLNGSYSCIKSLPNDIQQMQSLQQINFNNQKNFSQNPYNFRLKTLPDTISKLKNLTVLKLESNQIQRLPDKFGEMPKLKQLYMNGNQLEYLPDSFGNLASLVICKLYDNKLKCLPNTLQGLKYLKLLIISNNKLQELPQSFATISSLQILFINRNKIQSLLNLPENLIQFTCADNKIKEIPMSLLHMKRLTTAIFYNNCIEVIPEHLSYCLNLKILQMDNNCIEKLPAFIFKLNKLQQLSVSQNKIKYIEDISQNQTKISVLANLDLCDNQIDTMAQLCNLPKLQKLQLSKNKISFIPSQIQRLSNLQRFALNSNLISQICEDFVYLTKLREVQLNDNRLIVFPDHVLKLDSITFLKLNKNKLKTVSPMGHMENFRSLYLNDNELEVLPELPPNLKHIQLSNNKFQVFPSTMFKLKYIRQLKMGSNLFKSLPPQFEFLGSSLIYVQLEQSILDEPSKQIMKKLRERMRYN